MSKYWSRCEWEVVVSCWPRQENEEKIDVWQQLDSAKEDFLDLICDNLTRYAKGEELRYVVTERED